MAEEQPLSSRTERFLTDVAVFLGKFLATLKVLVFAPRRLAAAYLENKAPEELWVMPPLTFLVSSAFLFAIVFSFIMTGNAEWDGDFIFSYLTKEIGTQISIVRVFLLTLPIAAIVLLTIYLFDVLTSQREGRLKRVTFLSYIASFEMFGVSLFVIIKGIHDLVIDRRIDENTLRAMTGFERVLSAILLLGSAVIILITCLLVSFNLARHLVKVTKTDTSAFFRAGNTIALALMLQASIVMATFSAAALQRLPGDTRQTNYAPEFQIVEQSFRASQSGNVEVSIKIYIENETGRKVTIVDEPPERQESAPIQINWPREMRDNSYSVVSAPLKMVASAAGQSPYLEIPPYSRSWALFTGQINRADAANLREAVRSNQKREHIQLQVVLVRGESFSKPSTFMSQHFVPNF